MELCIQNMNSELWQVLQYMCLSSFSNASLLRRLLIRQCMGYSTSTVGCINTRIYQSNKSQKSTCPILPQYAIHNRNMHILVTNGVLWNLGEVHRGICDIFLFTRHFDILMAGEILKNTYLTCQQVKTSGKTIGGNILINHQFVSGWLLYS